MLVAIALSGCSALTALTRPDSEPTALAAPPAVGQAISGTGYSFTVPAGWGVPDGLSIPESVDALAGNLTDADGFRDTVGVSLIDPSELTPSIVELLTAHAYGSSGAKDVMVRNRVIVAGAETLHVSAIIDSDGSAVQLEQFHVGTDAHAYIVTLSFSSTVPLAERDALSHSVLASWAWA